jgi:NAD-dependent dihydropyrimidine dehydrogenase PreA subunit
MPKLVYLKDVVTLQLDEAKCVGCGLCLEVCPHDVFKMNGRRVLIHDRDACMECGACSRNCPTEALSVQAGVGCAAAVINGMLGRSGAACCCSIDAQDGCCTDSSKPTCGCG